jgi:hypothetical protein
MKLRMDRVLKGELSGSLADVTASKGPVPPFPKPAAWTAPYNKYSAGACHVTRGVAQPHARHRRTQSAACRRSRANP